MKINPKLLSKNKTAVMIEVAKLQNEISSFIKIFKQAFLEKNIRKEKGDDYYYGTYLVEKWQKEHPEEAGLIKKVVLKQETQTTDNVNVTSNAVPFQDQSNNFGY